MMSTQYRVEVLKYIERDDFENGCIDDPSNAHFGTVFKFQSSDLSLVRSRLESFISLEGAEEFEGKLETQRLEDGNGDEANAHQIEAWKAGRLPLWCASYSIYLEQVETKELSAALLLAARETA